MTAEEAEKRQRSQEATYLEARLEPILEKLEQDEIQKLKGKFRLPEVTDLDIRLSVGMLCVMDDLRNRLKQEISKGKGPLR